MEDPRADGPVTSTMSSCPALRDTGLEVSNGARLDRPNPVTDPLNEVAPKTIGLGALLVKR